MIASTAEIDEFYKEKGFVKCERYSAMLSPEACARYRKKNQEACKGCKGAIDVPQALATKMERTDMKKIVYCKECGEHKENHGRSLCQSCYARVQAKGRLDEYPSKYIMRKRSNRREQEKKSAPKEPGKPEQVEHMNLALNFNGHVQLWDELQKRATEQFRPIHLQAMWEIAKGLKAEEGHAGS